MIDYGESLTVTTSDVGLTNLGVTMADAPPLDSLNNDMASPDRHMTKVPLRKQRDKGYLIGCHPSRPPYESEVCTGDTQSNCQNEAATTHPGVPCRPKIHNQGENLCPSPCGQEGNPNMPPISEKKEMYTS